MPESAVDDLPKVQRHGHDTIELLIPRQCLREQAAQRLSQRANLPVLIKMNQLPQVAFVFTEGVSRMKLRGSQPAKGAVPVFIQRRAIEKRRTALGAEVLWRKRRLLRQAGVTNRNAGDFSEGLTAELAVIGKNERKDGSGGSTESVGKTFVLIRQLEC